MKAVFPLLRTFRCVGCGWRGWRLVPWTGLAPVGSPRTRKRRRLFVFLSLIIALAMAVGVSTYVARILGAPPADVEGQP
ncbi:MAG: hypothetical protein V2A73_22370 [Pseudomonadota bacterium]